jgi:hypothetical protein
MASGGSSLTSVWAKQDRGRSYSVPTSVRLIPRVDCQIADLRKKFPNLTQTQIINDLLLYALNRLEKQLLEKIQ